MAKAPKIPPEPEITPNPGMISHLCCRMSRVRRYEQLSLLLGDLIATHHTNYNGDGKPGFGIRGQKRLQPPSFFFC
ncbi:MAG: hypothetical protein HC789_07735 [Microcoleus sp. CSU_2_2]|nr:hypothetical protein [Microcoleus sp. SU_5_3]NJS10273.1 hypothetical protein [Microcoleus sp. CSU_2_2]